MIGFQWRIMVCWFFFDYSITFSYSFLIDGRNNNDMSTFLSLEYLYRNQAPGIGWKNIRMEFLDNNVTWEKITVDIENFHLLVIIEQMHFQLRSSYWRVSLWSNMLSIFQLCQVCSMGDLFFFSRRKIFQWNFHYIDQDNEKSFDIFFAFSLSLSEKRKWK